MGGNKRLSRGRRNRRHMVGDFTPYADWDPMMERELSAPPGGKPFGRERELSYRLLLVERDLSTRTLVERDLSVPSGRGRPFDRELSARTLVEDENPFGRLLRGKKNPEKTADKLLDFFE